MDLAGAVPRDWCAFGWGPAGHENNASRCKPVIRNDFRRKVLSPLAITAKKKSTKKRPRIADGLPVFKKQSLRLDKEKRGKKTFPGNQKGIHGGMRGDGDDSLVHGPGSPTHPHSPFPFSLTPRLLPKWRAKW